MPRKGQKQTEKAKRKISVANSVSIKKLWENPEYRSHMSEIHKGKSPSNLKNLITFQKSPEGREKVSQRMMGHIPWNKGKKMLEISGENHYAWIKDRSEIKRLNDRNNAEYKQWRTKVKKRDNNICQLKNGNCEGYNIVHHIKSWTRFKKLRYEINNGITLCQAHHPLKRAEELKLTPIFSELVLEIAN